MVRPTLRRQNACTSSRRKNASLVGCLAVFLGWVHLFGRGEDFQDTNLANLGVLLNGEESMSLSHKNNVKMDVVVADTTPTSDATSVTKTNSGKSKRATTKQEVKDPSTLVFVGQDLNGDSSTATVMGMATGYSMAIYQTFVGTLRKSGFTGHIILGVAPDVGANVKRYFRYRNVTMKIMQWTDCTYRTKESDKEDIFKKTTCAHPYPDIKIRWSRFPLARDWLEECKTCTGPVLITDVRDTIFQLDPFGPGSPMVTGLHVFEEHKNQTTKHWLTDHPFKQCKGLDLKRTMLCSGTTVGTRTAMLQYLQDMCDEMKIWINDPKCRFNFNGDDQSIHNYLFYTDKLPYATAIPNRHGGIVNTVGVEGAILHKQNTKRLMQRDGISEIEAKGKPYIGATSKQWIGKEHNLIDDEGYFTEFDGSRSRVVHQYDRLGRAYSSVWMNSLPQRKFFQDPVPANFV